MDISRYTKAAAGYAGRVKKWGLAHKVWSGLIIIVVLVGGYYTYAKATATPAETRYVTTTVATGTVIATITETGQVSATSNIDIGAKASGEVLSVQVHAGQHVGAGAVIATIDPTDALQAVASAKASLENAQISLAKLQEPANASSLTNAQNSVASAQASLTQAHEGGYNDVSSAFTDLPNVMAGIDTILHGNVVQGRTYEENENAYSDLISQYDPSVVTYELNAENSYQTAYTAYKKALNDFNATPRSADDATVEATIKESYAAAADISDALKASTDFLSFVNTTLTNRKLQIPSSLGTQLTTLASYTSQTNSHVAALSGDASTISSSERSLAAAQASLTQLQAGADALDVQSSQLSIQQQQNNLANAQTDLANTVVRAPFAGTVASLAIQKYQTISSGTAVAVMVSDNQTVDLSLNEVDAAKLQVGQKATLTFDALPDITIAGTVSSVAGIGTVSSGVVSYDATVTFDTPNASVKPGMSASADIIIGNASGLVVPVSAVKTVNGASYVQVFDPPLADSSVTGAASLVAPTRVPVTIGLASDDDVLITSGVAAGTQVVVSTSGTASTATAKTSAAQSTSLFGGSTGGARPAGGGRGL